MLGGGISGFVMKLIGTQMESQARQFERMIGKQQGADASADAAAKRNGGVLVRRFLVVSTVFAIVIAPFVFAWTDVGVSVAKETNGFLGLFKGVCLYLYPCHPFRRKNPCLTYLLVFVYS